MVLSLDFGGTKLAAGLVELETGSLAARLQIPTPPDAESSIGAILDLAGRMVSSSIRLEGVGVSFGGLVGRDGRTVRRSHHVPGWDGFPLAERLEAHFQVPAQVTNDADAAALGEYHFGAGRGVGSLLYLTVSSGIGGGIVLDGKLLPGAHALAGEVGHMCLLPDGPLCPCGRRGCLEALSSGRSIARRMTERVPAHPSGQPWTAQLVAQAAASGDPTAQAVWAEAMRWLGIGIASAANLLDPGRVVVGGGLSRAGAQLFEPVRAAALPVLISSEIEIVPGALDVAANLLGAAALFHP
jgi:glucokinase